MQKRGVVVLGVSAYDIASHRKFAEKYGSPPHLVQDELGKAMNAFQEIVVLFEQKRATQVREKMVVLVPIRAFAKGGVAS